MILIFVWHQPMHGCTSRTIGQALSCMQAIASSPSLVQTAILRAGMESISDTNFGPLIAYLVPGATVLLGVSPFSATLQGWFAATPPTAPTLGGFLYLTVASLAVGMAVSAIRWVIVDTSHAWTGLPPPPLDFSRLGTNVEAMSLLIAIHYRHYLFYANMFVATALAYASYRLRLGLRGTWGWIDVGFVVMETVFYVTSRDTLRKYYMRSCQVLQTTSSAAVPRSG